MMDDVACNQNHCTLSMDEMKIKSSLVFDKYSGSLVGFVDLGEVNHDIEMFMCGEGEKSTSKKLADQVFVFMARAAFKPSLSMPVAHYFSLNLTGIIKFYNLRGEVYSHASTCICTVMVVMYSKE